MEQNFHHISILLDACLEALRISPAGVYVDATMGGAGHSLRIAERLAGGRLVCIDRDDEAIANARERLAPVWERVTVVKSDFRSIDQVLASLGLEKVNFLGNSRVFPSLIIGTDVWKEFGYNSVVYLAALTGIDPGLYEAANIDGANRFKQIWHITVPALLPTVVLMTALNLGNILNAGFDQIFNLYNPIVYETADIIDTYVYRIGMVERQYSIGAAVGLLKSVISFALILGANKCAKKATGSGIF